MRDVQALFKARIKNASKKENALKEYMVLAGEFDITKTDEEIVEIKYFNTKAEAILPKTDLKSWFSTNFVQSIQKDIEKFQEKDSGWSLRVILHLFVHINKYNPMKGSSYIELPDTI